MLTRRTWVGLLAALFALLLVVAPEAFAAPRLIQVRPFPDSRAEWNGANSVTRKFYVAADDAGVVRVLDEGLNFIKDIPGARFVAGLSVDSVANRIYVSRLSPGVLVISGDDDTPLGNLDVACGAIGNLVVNPVSKRLYVSCQDAGIIAVFDTSPPFPVRIASIPRPSGQCGCFMAVNTVTNTIYMETRLPEQIVVIDGASNTVSGIVSIPGQTLLVAVDEGLNRVYVTSLSATVWAVDGVTHAVSSLTLSHGGSYGIAVNQANHRVFVANNLTPDGALSAIDGGAFTEVPPAATTPPFPTFVAFMTPNVILASSDTNRAIYLLRDQGGSLVLNGTTAYAEAAHAADLNITSDWTIEAWFRDDEPGGFKHEYRQLLNKGDGVQREAPYFLVEGENQVIAGVRTASVNYAISANLRNLGLRPGDWHHVAATLHASTNRLALYVDGQLVSEITIPAHATLGNTLPLELGRAGPSLSKYWRGALDDVRIWSVARSAAEIAANFHNELPGGQPGLVANWQFNDLEDGVARDSTGHGHDAHLFGGAVIGSDVHP